jgi:flavin-dependent dehydrogenase
MPAAIADAAALDVLVVGAGPAGSATALALRQAGVARVALLEARPAAAAPGWRLGETATPDLPALLARLGLAWPEGHRRCQGNASAWGHPLLLDDFVRRRLPPAWHVDRALLDAQLRAAAVQAGALLLQGRSLGTLRRVDGGWRVALHTGRAGGAAAAGRADAAGGAGTWGAAPVSDAALARGPAAAATVTARLLVDASGRAAVLARRLGARRQAADRQVALAAPWPLPDAPGGAPVPGPAHPLRERVLVEAVPEGWWYAAPDALGRPQLALMTDAELAPALRAPQAWWAALRRSQALWPALAPWAPPEAVPAGLRPVPCAAHAACLDRIAGPGWLALGDAMMSLDPLTSSGLSGALRDAWAATHGVLLPWLAGENPEAPAQAWAYRARGAWQEFLRQRRARHAQVRDWPQAPYWRRRLERVPASESNSDSVPTAASAALPQAGAPGLTSPRSSRTAPRPPSP